MENMKKRDFNFPKLFKTVFKFFSFLFCYLFFFSGIFSFLMRNNRTNLSELDFFINDSLNLENLSYRKDIIFEVFKNSENEFLKSLSTQLKGENLDKKNKLLHFIREQLDLLVEEELSKNIASLEPDSLSKKETEDLKRKLLTSIDSEMNIIFFYKNYSEKAKHPIHNFSYIIRNGLFKFFNYKIGKVIKIFIFPIFRKNSYFIEITSKVIIPGWLFYFLTPKTKTAISDQNLFPFSPEVNLSNDDKLNINNVTKPPRLSFFETLNEIIIFFIYYMENMDLFSIVLNLSNTTTLNSSIFLSEVYFFTFIIFLSLSFEIFKDLRKEKEDRKIKLIFWDVFREYFLGVIIQFLLQKYFWARGSSSQPLSKETLRYYSKKRNKFVNLPIKHIILLNTPFILTFNRPDCIFFYKGFVEKILSKIFGKIILERLIK